MTKSGTIQLRSELNLRLLTLLQVILVFACIVTTFWNIDLYNEGDKIKYENPYKGLFVVSLVFRFILLVVMVICNAYLSQKTVNKGEIVPGSGLIVLDKHMEVLLYFAFYLITVVIICLTIDIINLVYFYHYDTSIYKIHGIINIVTITIYIPVMFMYGMYKLIKSFVVLTRDTFC